MNGSSMDKTPIDRTPINECKNETGSTGTNISNVPFNADEFIVGAFQIYGIMLVGSMVVSYLFMGTLNIWPGSFEKLAIGLGSGAVLGFSVFLLSRFLVSFPRWKKLFEGLRDLRDHLETKDIFILAVMSGLGEEAFFRGLLQPWLGIPAASLIFALFHAPQLFSSDEAQNSSFSLWPWFALFIGIALGWLTILTGTWLSSALAHFLVNYLNLMYICSACEGEKQ